MFLPILFRLGQHQGCFYKFEISVVAGAPVSVRCPTKLDLIRVLDPSFEGGNC